MEELTLNPNYKELLTWFNERVVNIAPPSNGIELPSCFQIGDEVEIFTSEEDCIPGVVYSIKYSGNGTVKYDVAIPVKGSEKFVIITDMRGSMRAKGSELTRQEVLLGGNDVGDNGDKRNLFTVIK